MSNLRDSEDISQIKRKDLERYIIDNQKYLYRIAFTYMKNKDDTLDVVQNAIYKALSSVNLLKDINLIKPWVTRILINNCIDTLKRNKKIILDDDIIEITNDDSNGVLDKLVLKNAMESLPTQLKSIIILRFFEDFKIKDISLILDINQNTVKTNLYKALKILKIKLEGELADE